MFKSYRWKLSLAYILIITLILALLGSIIYANFKDYYLKNLEERLTREAFLVADMTQFLNSDDDIARSYQNICDIAAKDSATRVTIIDGNGLVWGDSSAQLENMDSHSNRPEVYKALHGEVGVQTRFSDTVQMNMLYVAVPLDNQEIKGAVRMAMPLTELQAVYDRILSMVLMAILISGLIALILSYFLAKFISRPLQVITEAVEDMASGNLKRRISYNSTDEMGILSQAFNEMGQHFERSMNEISEVKNRLEALLNNTVNGIVMIGDQGRITYANPVAISLLNMGNDYTGRNHVEIISVYELLEMIHAAKISLKPVQKNIVLYTLGTKTIEVNVVPIKNEKIACQDILIVLNDITEIKRLETVRKEFVANVSHELKTPVASISGFAETLLDEAGENPENVAEFTRIIYDESQRLSRLISRLLELSKLESDETKLNIEPININQLLRETVEIMRKTSKLRNIDILFDEQENIPIVNSDGDLINQIIMNFLDNAVKYSADESQIEVKLEELRDQVKISVKDYGIGIPEKEIPRIFERFFRVDKDRSRKTGGSGLGLSIVKHLAENLGGQVAVESKEGQGSTFSLSLPK
jgi:two-component system phosphate regulon sensor histidine kinase PhoR